MKINISDIKYRTNMHMCSRIVQYNVSHSSL